MKKALLALAITAFYNSHAVAQSEGSDEKIQELELRIQQLETALDTQVNAIADEVERVAATSSKSRVHIGGYGEMHYNHLDQDGEDIRELDFHRFVLFVGYDFNERVRLVSEVEVEHTNASAGARGAVELEQAYIEIDLRKNMRMRTGVMLMPIGIVNETHEPPTFNGVERPIVETTIIPSTWYVNGVSLVGNFDNGVSYDVIVSEGFKTDDPNSDPLADPFDLKAGKQKGSFSSAFDLALTGRINYRGISGLELSAYAQYQPDLDQSAQISYAEDATLIGGHAIYQWQALKATALYSRWDLAGDAAEAAGKNVQDGGYVELEWAASPQWKFFGRQSAWSQVADVNASQTKVGVNYYPHADVVLKFDVQAQNNDAGNSDGFNLGVGYQF